MLNKSARSFPKQAKDLIRAETDLVVVDDRTVTLALSESRAYDSALEIRGAYKLTGNFHTNLTIVLEHLAALDDVTFEIEPKSWLTSCQGCRHVEFRRHDNVQRDRFAEILQSIKGRIGFVCGLNSANKQGSHSPLCVQQIIVLSGHRNHLLGRGGRVSRCLTPYTHETVRQRRASS